jgi:hypothetical protein
VRAAPNAVKSQVVQIRLETAGLRDGLLPKLLMAFADHSERHGVEVLKQLMDENPVQTLSVQARI